MPFEEIEQRGRIYIGIYGDTGAGKTYTAVDIALAAREHLGLAGPICVIDTEKAYRHHVKRCREQGVQLLVSRTRDLDVVKKDLAEAKKANASIVIIDSFTHILESERDRWCAKQKKERYQMETSDYKSSDRRFKELLDKMLLSDQNMICCAREQMVYGWVKNKKGEKKQAPVSTKFGAGKAGYEFDLLLDLKQIEEKGRPIKQIAVVKKDRTKILQGKVLEVPWNAPSVLAPYFDYQMDGQAEADQQGDAPEGGA